MYSVEQCSPGWRQLGDWCYLVSDNHAPMTFDVATGVCDTHGGELIIVLSDEELNWIESWRQEFDPKPDLWLNIWGQLSVLLTLGL